ncbi:GTP-binding protein [Anaerotignum propionicum]|uniref:CobW family GTP-binding protein n=1 Tax=Anaerotignum propionicum TaxID=28446 RepID=UPI00289DDF93|nr:GTP-binding protein [Anaerotignum propionicum]
MTKIDIISGFLGSGKTTLIKKLLDETFFQEKIVVIENEFGEMGIDGAILKKSGIEIKELYSGCICCSLVGDFEQTIQEVIYKFHPERIIIEPSGVGKLSEVLKACKMAGLQDSLQINMLITVVDVLKFEMYLTNFGEFFKNQIAHAKTILLSRTEKASQEALEKVISDIRKINDMANVVTTPLENLNGEKIISIAEGNGVEALENLMEEVRVALRGPRLRSKKLNHHEGLGCNHEHHADEVFEVWGMETPKAFNEERIKNNFAMLENESKFGVVLRGKGFLQVEDAWIQFDYTPGEINVKRVEPEYTGKVCIIGCQLNGKELEKLFQTVE